MTIWFANLMEKNRTTNFAKEERLLADHNPRCIRDLQAFMRMQELDETMEGSYTDKE